MDVKAVFRRLAAAEEMKDSSNPFKLFTNNRCAALEVSDQTIGSASNPADPSTKMEAGTVSV